MLSVKEDQGTNQIIKKASILEASCNYVEIEIPVMTQVVISGCTMKQGLKFHEIKFISTTFSSL